MAAVIWFNLYYWPVFAVVTVVLYLVYLPIILVGQLVLPGRSLASTIRCFIRWYGWILVCLVPFLRPAKVVRKGSSLPQPAILVPNHTSSIDPYVFGALAIENSFVTSWPFAIPFFGLFMRMAKYVDARQGWPEVARGVKALLAADCSVTIWPEGHRTRTGEMGRFRRGAFELAVQTGRPLVPVCITGSRTVMPAGQHYLRPATVRLVLLEPVYPRQDADHHQEVRRLRQKVRAMIVEELAQSQK